MKVPSYEIARIDPLLVLPARGDVAAPDSPIGGDQAAADGPSPRTAVGLTRR